MQNFYKVIKQNKEAREAIKRGVDVVANLVRSTMGPGGRNVLLEWKEGVTRRPPIITNDGIRIAKNIILKDEIEDLGAQAIINSAKITNDMVGDGTTATIVIAQAIIAGVFNKLDEEDLLINSQSNLMAFHRQIKTDEIKAIEMLQKKAKQIKTKADLETVAITSIEDEEWGKVVADMAWQTGKDGYIAVDEYFGNKVETEVVEGMKFTGTYVSEVLCTTQRKEAILEDPLILITTHTIENQDQLVDLAKHIKETYKISSCVLIANNYDKTTYVEQFCFANIKGRAFYMLAIKAPSMHPDQFQDIATYTGAKLFEKEKGIKFGMPALEEFGRAKKIIVDRDNVFIVQGKGEKDQVKLRIEKLKQEMEIEEVESFKNQLKQRIASLSGGIGIIKVATNSNVKTGYLKNKFEDAVCACKAALEEGIVKGGGTALKEIAEKMPKSIIAPALKACYNQIQENAGGNLEIADNIFDPVKVIRVALENACSLAGVLITANGAIAEKRESVEVDDLKKLLTAKERPAYMPENDV